MQVWQLFIILRHPVTILIAVFSFIWESSDLYAIVSRLVNKKLLSLWAEPCEKPGFALTSPGY